LADPVGGVVKPTNTGTHIKYTFYIKASTAAGANGMFGAYILDVGCTSTSTGMSDNSITTTQSVTIAPTYTNIYTAFNNPNISPSRAYCSHYQNLV